MVFTHSRLRRDWCLALIAAFCFAALEGIAQVIPESNRVAWVPGVTVGVQSHVSRTRTNLLNAHTTYGADNTGATNAATAINAAIAAAVSNDVVFLPAGTYRLDATVTLDKSYVTLRGEGTNTILSCTTNTVGHAVYMGHPANEAGAVSIVSGAVKGSTNLLLASLNDFNFFDSFGVGSMVRISTKNSDFDNMHVISVAGAERLITQTVTVQSINGSSITFTPPLVWDFNNDPVAVQIYHKPRKGVGLENLAITATNHITHAYGTPTFLVTAAMLVNSWITNVDIGYAKNYALYLTHAIHCDVDGNDIHHQLDGTSPNHAGVLAEYTTGCLIQNNIIREGLFPAVEFNSGFAGNAVFGNYFINNSYYDISCHNTHPMMNLFEANVINQKINLDGYFGSSSHHTFFRNKLATQFLIKRFNSNLQIVGNVFGQSEYSQSFCYTTEDSAYGAPYPFLEMGFPHIGNNFYAGTTPPTAWNYPGNSFVDSIWTRKTYPNGFFIITNTQLQTTNIVGNFTNVPPRYGLGFTIKFQDSVNTNKYWPDDGYLVAVSAGTISNLHVSRPISVSNGWRVFIASQDTYSQLQSSDKFTHNITGNLFYTNAAGVLVWSENTNRFIPDSLLYTNGAPSWWGTNRWPAIDPQGTTFVSTIPAQDRFAGIPLRSGDETPPSVPLNLAAASDGYDRTLLTWDSATDNNGVTGYRVERSTDGSFVSVAVVTTSGFADSGLLGATDYSYRVQALDAAGNHSDFSSIASVTTGVAPPDQTPPSAPLGFTASVAGTDRINLSWRPATDNRGVTGYKVERAEGNSGFVEVATTAATNSSDGSLTPATTYNYRVRAADAAGNLSDYSPLVTIATADMPDTVAPTIPQNTAATPVGSDTIIFSWKESADNVGVAGYRIERAQGTEEGVFAEIASMAGTSFSDAGLETGATYYYRVRAVDAAGNASAFSFTASAVAGSPAPVIGLVAAYNFNESLGSAVLDGSGLGNAGTISGAARTDLGKYGRALAFNGVDNTVLVNSSFSLNSTSAMTMQAWVKPSSIHATWAAILHREPDSFYLHVSSPDGAMRPAGGGVIGAGEYYVSGPSTVPLNEWTHLATTYDGNTLRLYVNGAEVSSRPITGGIQGTTAPLRIGGNTYPGQFFDGLIDEVRIYRRALTASEIAADMNTPVVNVIPKPAVPGGARISVR